MRTWLVSLLGLLLCSIASAAAQTFHVETGQSDPGRRANLDQTRRPADRQGSDPGRGAQNDGGIESIRCAAALSLASQSSPRPRDRWIWRRRKPQSGTYADADIRGLFWSMSPVEGGDIGALKPLQVRLTASSEGRVLTSMIIQFIDSLPTVKVGAGRRNSPAQCSPRCRGQLRSARRSSCSASLKAAGWVARDHSPRFASRGFAVLGLALLLARGAAPRACRRSQSCQRHSPISRSIDSDAAFQWLKRRADVDASRIALVGTSKGAEFVLIAASRFKWITSVVAIGALGCGVGGLGPRRRARASALRSRSDGKPLPFVPYVEFAEEFAGFQHRAGREDAALPGQGARGESRGSGAGAHRGRELRGPCDGRRRTR